jgi:anti-sigma factor (TIGR02949 family)
MNCSTAERYLDAFLDGEVDPSAGIEVERHLASCASCAERLKFAEWLKRSVKQQQAEPAVPQDLRSRIESALDAERSAPIKLDLSWRATAAAAAVALCVFGVGGALEMKGPALQTASMVTPILEDVLRAHARDVPTEVAQRDQVPAYFEQRVGFKVRPVEFGDPSVRFVGARDIQAGGRHAATMQYEVHGRRLTVVAFRPPAGAGQIGEPANFEGQEVRFVRVMGHLVPIVQHDGVVYAVLGDLEPEDRLAMATRAAMR